MSEAADAATALAGQGPEAYAEASRQYLNDLLFGSSIAAAADLPVETDEERRLLTALLGQPVQDDDAVEFLKELTSSYHDTGDARVLEVAAKRILPVLVSARDTGAMTKDLLLTLFVVREYAQPEFPQDEISRLLHESFYDFSYEDLKLPFSFAFKGAPFRSSMADLEILANTLAQHWKTDSRIRLHHAACLSFTFPNLLDFLQDEKTLLEFITRLFDNEVAEPRVPSLEAARALLVRFLDSEAQERGAQLEQVLARSGTGPGFRDVLTEARARRRSASEGVSAEPSGVLANVMGQKLYQGATAAVNLRPALLTGFGVRRRLRVAVCVSGQLRGYQEAFRSWQQTLLRDVDAHFFVHTWQNVGRATPSPFRTELPWLGPRFSKAYRESCTQIGFEEMQSRYSALFALCESTATVSEEELRSFYGTHAVVVEDDQHPSFASYSNPDKMHYKIRACHELMEELGEPYDLCMRIRPDKEVSFIGFRWRDLAKRCTQEALLFADNPLEIHFGHPTIGDQFAVGRPAVMAQYADCFRFSPRVSEHGLLGWPQQMAGHVNLAFTCWALRIGVERVAMKSTRLLEAAPVLMDEVLEAVRCDAVGRMDAIDRILLEAIREDLA